MQDPFADSHKEIKSRGLGRGPGRLRKSGLCFHLAHLAYAKRDPNSHPVHWSTSRVCLTGTEVSANDSLNSRINKKTKKLKTI